MNKLFASAFAVFVTFSTSTHAAQTNLNDRLFTLPDGFTLELVAAAPLVNRPISIAFDPQGRLYATDSSGSNEKAPPNTSGRTIALSGLKTLTATGVSTSPSSSPTS